MVKDPVEFTGNYSEVRASRVKITEATGEPLFYIAHITLDQYSYLVLRANESLVFAVTNTDPRSDMGYVVDDEHVSRTEFVTYVKENYPDHFEWLLFHQEWL